MSDEKLRAAMLATLRDWDQQTPPTPAGARRMVSAARFARELATATGNAELLELADELHRRWAAKLPA